MPPAPVSSQRLVNPDDIKGMDEEDKLNYIGERIYPIIEELYGDNAPKITGMIIDMEPDDLMSTLESRQALEEKASEANKLLLENPDE